MNIAIIGGSGFIGRHTARELIRYGHTVSIFDKVSPFTDSFFNQHDTCRLRYQEVDALNLQELYHAFQFKDILRLRKGFDVVYMFAAISDSKENHTDIQHAVETNIMSLTNTLKVCEDLNIPRIIFSSTVWVYSVVENREYVSEEQDLSISNTDHIYTTCKLACESIVRNYCEVRDIDYTILRYGIAYGPGCHPDTILSKFISNALNGIPLTITGTGDTYRNFLYVDDHARGNRLALCENAKNKIINLEGAEPITLDMVAKRVKELHNEDVEILYTSARHGDYKGKHVSNSKSKSLLGWTPTVDFKTGSKKLYEYIKENINHCATC